MKGLHALRALCLAGLMGQAAGLAQEVSPQRLHIIGASVSGGFTDGPLFGAERQGRSVPLYRVLKAWCGDATKVTTHPLMEMGMLFRDPLETGEKMIRLARRRAPDVVVALDFLFWFAYGYVDGDPLVQRPARFERGLALLGRIEVPLIVGDLPDMRGAATRMLKPRQIPSRAMLQRLNRRLSAWAKVRGDVVVAPLSGLIRELKEEGSALPLQDGELRTPPGALLQADRLHATRLGMALLTFRLQGALQQLFPKAHPLHGRAWSFAQFVDAARAQDELDELRAAVSARRGR